MERGLKIQESERTKTTNSLLVSLMNQLGKDVELEPQHTGNDTNPTLPQLPFEEIGFHQYSTTTPELPDGLRRQISTNIQPSPPPFLNDYASHTADYPSFDYRSAHPSSRLDDLNYSQIYRGQSYPQEPRQPPHILQYYPSQDMSASYSYPSFHSYPSFSESSLPAAPSHYPSYSQGSDVSYSCQSAPSPSVTNYSSAPQYNPSNRNGITPDAAASSAQTFTTTAITSPHLRGSQKHKRAARFAVGALAFDEVPVAVEHLRKALEYLANASAGQ